MNTATKIVVTLPIFVLLAGFCSGQSRADEFDNAEPIIQQHCLQHWPDNFEMREFCETQQREAVAKLRAEHAKAKP